MLFSIAILRVSQLAGSPWAKRAFTSNWNDLALKHPVGLSDADRQVAATLIILRQAQGCPLLWCTTACACSASAIQGRLLETCPLHPSEKPLRGKVGLLLTNGDRSTGVCFSLNENFCGKRKHLFYCLSRGPVFINWEFWWKIFNQP